MRNDHQAAEQPQQPETLRVDARSREIFVGDRRINARLSRKEFDLLLCLYERAGEACSREDLGKAVWGSVDVGGRQMSKADEHMLHALIHRLRGKLRNAGLDLNRYVTAVAGVGYRLEAEPRPAGEAGGNGNGLGDSGDAGSPWSRRAWLPAAAVAAAVGIIAVIVIALAGGDDGDEGDAQTRNGDLETPSPTAFAGELCGSEIISPEPGSVLESATVTFTWTEGCGMTRHDIWVGCSPGADDFLNPDDGVFFEATANNLPLDGGPIYVTLSSHNGTEEGAFVMRYEYAALDQGGGKAVIAEGTKEWVDTGIGVSEGQELEIDACGQTAVAAPPVPRQKPDGDNECPGAYRLGFPAPDLPCWSLLGRIGGGDPFLVGSKFAAPAPSTGRLYIEVNDDNFADNDAGYRATIRVRDQ